MSALQCVTCGRVGSEEDGIELFGQCLDDCSGTVEAVRTPGLIPEAAIVLEDEGFGNYSIRFTAPNGATTYVKLDRNVSEPELVVYDILEHLNAWLS